MTTQLKNSIALDNVQTERKSSFWTAFGAQTKRIRPIEAQIRRKSGVFASCEAQMRRFGAVLRRYRNVEWTDVSRYEPILSRCEPVAANDYDLSLNRYKEVVHEAVEHDSPQEILERLAKLEEEIASGRKELEGLLG